MTYINWDQTFQFGSLELPTYGNYGGDDYSAGLFGGEPPTGPLNSPLTEAQLDAFLRRNNDRFEAVDPLDYAFYLHDVATGAAGGNAELQNLAGPQLLTQVVSLQPETFDRSGEASLYAGFTTLGMIYQLVENGGIEAANPLLLATALTDAISDIQYGLEHLKPKELETFLSDYFDRDTNGTKNKHDDVFYFNFEITTNSLEERAIEFNTLSVLSSILNEPAQGDELILDTGGNPSSYHLTFNPVTRDLDIHSGIYIA